MSNQRMLVKKTDVGSLALMHLMASCAMIGEREAGPGKRKKKKSIIAKDSAKYLYIM